jgi:hypothetical protein
MWYRRHYAHLTVAEVEFHRIPETRSRSHCGSLPRGQEIPSLVFFSFLPSELFCFFCTLLPLLGVIFKFIWNVKHRYFFQIDIYFWIYFQGKPVSTLKFSQHSLFSWSVKWVVSSGKRLGCAGLSSQEGVRGPGCSAMGVPDVGLIPWDGRGGIP